MRSRDLFSWLDFFRLTFFLRLTVKILLFLRLTAKFLAVSRLTVNPIETIYIEHGQLLLVSLYVKTRGTNSWNSMPFLAFRRDHLRSTMGIICGSGSFADQFRYGDHLRSGIICGAVRFPALARWMRHCRIHCMRCVGETDAQTLIPYIHLFPTSLASPLSRNVFTRRLISAHAYEVNITAWSSFLSIRKSKYQRHK